MNIFHYFCDMKMPKRWFPIPLHVKKHPMQSQLWNDIESRAYKYYIVAASRRSYKSERFIKRRTVLEALRNKGWDLYSAAPTFNQAKRLFWQDYLELIPNEFIKKAYSGDLIIELKNNSRITIVGLENHRRLQGSRFHFFGISESQLTQDEVFMETLFPTLIDVPESILVAEGRPLGKGNIFYELYKRGESTDPAYSQYKSYHWTAEGILTPEQILQAKRNHSEEDYEREFNASFNTAKSSPYHAYSELNHLVLSLDTKQPILISADFNATEKPMSWIIGQQKIYQNRLILYWHKEFVVKYTNTYEMSDIVLRYLETLGNVKVRFYGDFAGSHRTSNSSVSDWDIIKNKFAKYLMPYDDIVIQFTKSVRDSIGATNKVLKNALGEIVMYVNPYECKHLIDDWILTEWDSSGQKLDESNPERGHICRAVDYAVNVIYPLGESRIDIF